MIFISEKGEIFCVKALNTALLQLAISPAGLKHFVFLYLVACMYFVNSAEVVEK